MHRISHTIKLGTGLRTSSCFLEAFRLCKCGVGHWVPETLSRPDFRVSEHLMDVSLVAVSVSELGFKDGGKRSEVNAKAKTLGYSFCPAEVGPQFCLQVSRQKFGDHFHVGMNPIQITPGYARSFVCNFGENNHPEISTDWTHHGYPLPPTCQILFVSDTR